MPKMIKYNEDSSYYESFNIQQRIIDNGGFDRDVNYKLNTSPYGYNVKVSYNNETVASFNDNDVDSAVLFMHAPQMRNILLKLALLYYNDFEGEYDQLIKPYIHDIFKILEETQRKNNNV